jgi:threonyl-tRNA synthetase
MEESLVMKQRHSLSHIMAQAVLKLRPGSKVAIGPAIENGFYYDFLLSKPFEEVDLAAIEKEMKAIIKRDLPIHAVSKTSKEAHEFYKDEPFKTELLDEIGGEAFNFFITGENEFADLCKGPHVESTGKVGAFKLTSLAGAYWRGDEHKQMLTRVYGIAFETQAELEEYEKKVEDAKARDHRKLGKELDLFVFSEVVGKGLPLWTPRGATIRRELERFTVDEELRRGYLHVNTPDIARIQLYEKSGHYPYYKESMYAPIQDEEERFMLRPMTCPHHFELYLSKQRSYRELPMRIAELAQLYRYEKSGELSGLMRVRTFCLADAHIICKPEQAKQEIAAVLDLIEYISQTFGLKVNENYRFRLSLGNRTDSKKYYKDDAAWDFAENVLRDVLVERNAEFFEAEDEAAFYGPKIDFQMKNVLGKEDTAFTVQYDFVMPKRFKLNYIDEEGKEAESIVIHRSSIGAIERIMAFLIEHFAGSFPVWLHPEQVVVIPIGEDQKEFAQQVAADMKKEMPALRISVDEDNNTLGKRIFAAQQQKVPYILVVGKNEVANGTVAMRLRGGENVGELKVADAIARIKDKIESKALDL